MRIRKPCWFTSFWLILGLTSLGGWARAEDWSIAYLDELLANVRSDQRTIQVGDMEILVTNLRVWRQQLAGEPTAQSAFDGTAPLWTDGRVFYAFDDCVSTANQRAFLDGAAEWAIFANLQFIPLTTQAN